MGALPITDLRDIAERKDANAAGLPASTFHEWKRGQCDLSAKQMIALAGAIGFDVQLADKPSVQKAVPSPQCPCPCCPHAKIAQAEQRRHRYADEE